MFRQSSVVAASIAAFAALAAGGARAQGVCTYKDAPTSFGATYTTNAESSVTPLACTANVTAARMNDTSFGRSTITAPETGDFKFLVRKTTSNSTAPTFEMVASNSPEIMQFPDGNLAAPSGGGCDDGSGGVRAIEDHLHRSWPLFGQTYYYGDYIASPPNDPATVTSSTSPYVKWAPYLPTGEFVYLDVAGKWGPTGGNSPDGMHPVQVPGYAAGSGCSSAGLTLATEVTACNTCLTSKGYYLHDGATTGDLKKSVFKGTILNDAPPAWVHFSWGYGFITDFQVNDSSGKTLFPLVRDTFQASNSSSCPSTPSPQHVGGTYEPVGSSNCSIAYPTWNQTAVNALGMSPIKNDLSNIQGGNQAWGAGVIQSTPAGDLMQVSKSLESFVNGTCKYCQTKAILYLGFGQPCAEGYPSGLPTQTIAGCATGTECRYVNPAAACNTCVGVGNWIPDVTHYLYNSLNERVYFIGMGKHTASMRKAAVEGHGKYFDAKDAASFHDGLIQTLQDIIQTGTSSATSTVNAVQVNVAGQEELVPRFVAKQAGLWDGHMNKYFLFSEFAANCSKAGDLAPIPNPLMKVCDATCVCPGGTCSGRWLVDSQCKLLSPDATGFLFQSTWTNNALVPSTAAAVPIWDVNDQLRAGNWYQRKVYTAIDTNADGNIDNLDGDGTSPVGMYSITAGASAGNANLTGGVSDAVADALAPYMALDGTTMCADVESTLGILLPGPAAQRLRACARTILNFALGEDLLNENALDPTNPLYTIGDRVSMLGDVFHSSPQDIGPPVSEADCGKATRRCVTSLFNQKPGNGLPNYQPLDQPTNVIDPASGASIANPGTVDAYQAYYQAETFGSKRPRVTVFGANDGFVHAVQTACFAGTNTSGGVVSPLYWEGSASSPCAGNGSELWAFIPPDLLPKLGYLITGKHQYFVDNSPMVRDIYAPGTNATSTTITPAATKRYTTTASATMDFKRIAVFGEREGGTHWFGLDVTDPTAPQFRWIFPQPNTADELKTGFSWGDWVPNAPPIVPIRYAAPTGAVNFPAYTDSSTLAQPFYERWVAMLPGGYDPYGIVGKSVYMLDAYTGAKLYQTTDTANFKQDFSFAALPAAVPWGASSISAASPDYNRGFFDTAIVGDMGGQIWTLRFNDVGTSLLPPTWSFGRGFRESLADDSGAASGEYRMQHRTPIFQMAAVARMPDGSLRAFLATGDRANMAESSLGDCSLYNPLACGKRQCVETIATNAAINGNPSTKGVSGFKGDLAASYTSTTTSVFSTSLASCSPASTTLSACLSCSGGGTNATPAATAQPQYSCTNSATGWQCAVKPISTTSSASRMETTAGTMTPAPDTDIGYFSRLLAYKVFDTASRRIFTDATSAATYDGAAMTETNLVNLFASAASKTLSATVAPVLASATTGASPGYFFSYPVLDERTATNSILFQNCLSWYSMEPGQPCNSNTDCTGGTCNTATHTCVAPQACGASASSIPARTAFLYQINATDGSTNCGLTSSTTLRTAAPTNSFLVPPPPAQTLISVNNKGQVQYSIVAPAGQLSPPASLSGGGSTPFSFFYTVETSREQHECRHNGNASACQ
jgi:type IV pilus assembly protein PilY1